MHCIHGFYWLSSSRISVLFLLLSVFLIHVLPHLWCWSSYNFMYVCCHISGVVVCCWSIYSLYMHVPMRCWSTLLVLLLCVVVVLYYIQFLGTHDALRLPECWLTSVPANSGTPYVLFSAKVMPKFSVNFCMTYAKNGT